MKVFVEYIPGLTEERLLYVLDFISKHPAARDKVHFSTEGQEESDCIISYGLDNESGFKIPFRGMFLNKNEVHQGKRYVNSYTWQELEIFSVEEKEKGKAKFYDKNLFAFDIFDTLFFHISRYEERFVSEEKKNDLGMLDNKDLLLPCYNIEQKPVVDHLVYAFLSCIGIKEADLKSTYALTHDIDKIYKFNNFKEVLKGILWPLIMKRNFPWAFNNLKYALAVLVNRMKDPYDSFDFLFYKGDDIKNKMVYFMAGANSRFDLYDRNYRKKLPEIIKKAKEAGYGIAIHPSFSTADDEILMQREKSNLEKISGEEITNTRQHFLHYYFGLTDHIIDKIGFEKDSTLAYSRMIGFRCGTGYPYRLYDFENERAFQFFEEPLVVMDSSLIHQSGDRPEVFEEILNNFIENNRNFTRISFNFHNSSFDPTLISRFRLKEIYLQMLKTIT